MEIKDSNGNVHGVTGIGQGNLNTVLGALGTASFLGLGGKNGLGGILGGGNAGGSSEYVSRETFELAMQLASKDSRIALLESEKSTDAKLLAIRGEIQANKDEQVAINMANVQRDATTAATITAIQGNLAALNGMTQLVIPSTSVCNTGCGCNA